MANTIIFCMGILLGCSIGASVIFAVSSLKTNHSKVGLNGFGPKRTLWFWNQAAGPWTCWGVWFRQVTFIGISKIKTGENWSL